MAQTTPEKVKAIANHLQELDDSTIDIYIEDAHEELLKYGIEDERTERYLAAHFGTLNIRRTSSESIENVSVTYTNSIRKHVEGLQSTSYGQEALRLIKDEVGTSFVLLS